MLSRAWCHGCHAVDDGGLRRGLWHIIWSDHLREQDEDHVHADSTCTGNTDSLQRHREKLPLDKLLHLFRKRHD